jgi:hypothetical protein
MKILDKPIGAGDRLRIIGERAELIVSDFSRGADMVYGAVHTRGAVTKAYEGYRSARLRWPRPEERPLLTDSPPLYVGTDAEIRAVEAFRVSGRPGYSDSVKALRRNFRTGLREGWGYRSLQDCSDMIRETYRQALQQWSRISDETV